MLENHNSDLFDTYIPIYNQALLTSAQSVNLIYSNSVNSKYDCFVKCSSLDTCQLVSIDSSNNNCYLYDQINSASFVYSSQTVLYEKYFNNMSAINANLQYYWPFNSKSCHLHSIIIVN